MFFDIISKKREMKKTIFTFALFAYAFAPTYSVSATCSRTNLMMCLDSACAINISSNPAARCQYCGTSDAGSPSTDNGLQKITLGMSSKYTLTEKELESAPSDPGRRYAWASAECIKKVGSCTPDDVTEIYDSLIEQSCKAAGITAQMESLRKELIETKSLSECTNSIMSCLMSDNRCKSDFSACTENADFDNFFSLCSTGLMGCDEHIPNIRASSLSDRNTAIANAQKLIESIAVEYQNARITKTNNATNMCTNNSGRESCIKTVCERNMEHKCGTGYDSERAMATELCKFYDIACETLR